MALPTNVSFGTVTGTFLLASADSPADQDRDPEGTAATDLTFTFTPDLLPAVARDASATPPTMFALLPVPATVGQDGSLLGPDGAPGVRLVASTNANLQPHGWTWNVTLKSNTFPAMSFSFLLDPGATIDLSTVLQVPANPGGTLNAWLQAVSDAQAARDAAVAAAATVPSAASLAATYPTLGSGVEGAPKLSTTGQSVVVRRMLSALEAVAFTIFGDSYGQGGSGADNGTRFFDRVALRQRTLTPTNYAIPGTRSDQVLAQVETYWTPNSRGLVGVADVVLNDLIQYGADSGKATTVEAFRAILARLTALVALTPNSVSLVYGPNWSAGATATAGSYVDIAWTGDACYIPVGLVTGSGATITIKDTTGATVKTFATGGYLNAFTGMIKLAGFGAGTHSVRASVSAAASILGVIVPAPAPPVVLWNKPGAILYSASTNNPLITSYLAACQAILTDFPTVIPVPVDSGWDNTTMLGPDGLHPNDKGHAYIASLHEAALAGLGFRQGLNQLTAANGGTYNAPAVAYTAPGATTPTAPTSVAAAAANQATVTWARGADGGATITSQVIQASSDSGATWADVLTGIAPSATSITITSGLTAGTSYVLRVVAVNSVGRGAASAASAAITAGAVPATYALDSFTRSTLGSTETGSYAWSSANGSAWTCNGTQLINSSAPTNTADCFIDDGQANGTLQVARVSGAGAGIVFRASGTGNLNGYIFWNNGGTYTLSKRTALNSYSALQTASLTPANGDVMTVVLNGSSIVCKVNGVAVITTTDSAYTGTRHGVWTISSTPATFDDFKHSSVTS